MKPCPCTSGRSYSDCCGKFISGKAPAPTSEALMRSRYTAYTQADMDYIERTMKGKALEGFNKQDVMRWASGVKWLGLDVIDALEESPKGWVEFKAHFLQGNQKQILHERSEFLLEGGCWYYIDGTSPKAIPVKTSKMGRNDLCPCGSQKKFKKCCGAANR